MALQQLLFVVSAVLTGWSVAVSVATADVCDEVVKVGCNADDVSNLAQLHMNSKKLHDSSKLSAGGVKLIRKEDKFVAGVPVLNYDEAYGGVSSASLTKDAKEHWIVVVKAGTTDAQIQKMCEVSNGCERMGHPGAGGVPFFEIYGSESDLALALNAASGVAEFVEPDGTVSVVPDVEEAASASWGLDRVGAPLRANEGNGVHVYVLDTGVRRTHIDFTGRVVPTLDLTSGVLVECGIDLNCAGDIQGHGTHCAGTVAGISYGVAPGATVHSVKVIRDIDAIVRWSWVYASLDWLATKGLRPAVASMSLQGTRVCSAMKTAVDVAVNSGVTVVVSAGNYNSDSCGFTPAFVPSAITVGSTTATDARSSFSNYGACTNIWAPGSSIVSADFLSDTGDRVMSGTSMAAPHVSGAAALILENNPTWLSPAVLAEMQSKSEKGAISDLTPADVNYLLWVGSGPAPAPAELSCPSFAVFSQPDFEGDCECAKGTICSTNNDDANCPTASGGLGGWGGRYFYYTCTNCFCIDA